MTRPNGGGLLRPQDLDIGSFFESTQDAVIVAEAFTGRIVLWNPVASEVFGYSPVEALGMNVEEFVPGRLKARHQAQMSVYHETARSPYIDSGTVLDLPAVRKDGEEVHVELTLSTIEPVRDAGLQGQFILAIIRDATVRKRAEEEGRRFNAELEQLVVEATAELEAAGSELRDSEERYRWLVESLKDYAIFIVEADGSIASWNVGAERIFGYREEEIIDKDFSILFTREDTRHGVPERELRKAAAEGRAEDERWHVRKDGSRFWASGIAAPIRDETGNLRGFTKVARDLTERKLAAQALEESEERLRATFEQAAVGIALAAPDGRWLRVNDKLCEIVGYPREELLEMSWKDIAHSEDVEADLEQMSRLSVGEIGTYSMEQRYVRKDGSIVWVKLTVSLVREPSGEPKYFFAVVEDVTERKKDHEQLAYHSSLLENVRDAVLATDERFVLTAWNRGAEEMYGWKASEALGRQVGDVVRSELTDEQRAEALRELSETGRFRVEVITYHKDGTPIHTEGIIVTLPGEPGRIAGYLSINRDITEHKRAEEKLRESEERLRRVIQIETVGVIFFKTDGSITDANDAFLRMSGYSREDLMEGLVRWDGMTPPEWMPHSLKAIEEFISTGRTMPYEKEYIRKDGSRWWALFAATRLDEKVGVEFIIDITERKRAEEELRKSGERITNILESITDAFVAVDREWRYTYINERALGHLQGAKGEELTREEVLGTNMWEVFPEGVGSVFYEKYHEALREQKTVHFEAYSPPRDRWVEQHAYPSEEGLSIYYQDITERKRAQKEIETRTHQQAVVAELGRRALAETELSVLMDDAVAVLANTLGVEYCEVLELLPSGDELLLRAGVGWEEGLVGSARVGAGLDSQAGYTLLSSEPVIVKDLRTEERFQRPPQLHQHEVVSGMSVVIYSGDGPFGVLGVHTKEQLAFSQDDINFLQAVANVLAAAIERVEAEEKLHEVREAERSRLARDLHDEALQDLTRALAEMQLVQQISEDPKLNQRLERVGEALKRAGRGMHRAINDLRLEGEAREQTLVEMLESLVGLNRRASPECEIDLSVEEGFSPTLSRTQQVELLRTLREALTNALRHSGADRIRIAAGTSGGKLWAEVEDDGRGFDPMTTDAGMGIRGMRERTRALGGDLKISSKPGEGTQVRFELTLKKDREEPAEVRILLVEDHAVVRQATASVFEREPGFSVVGQAGSLSRARKMLDGVDVAVVDLGLPDGYGGELIKELRSHNPQAQALVLSAMLDRAEIARAVERGAAGVLHKSAGINEVVEAVRRLSAGETLLPLGEVVELLRFAGSRREEEYEAHQAIARLTSREKEVLQALAEGLDSREIAERLHISVKTEANHVTSILNKLGVHSRLQALVFAIRYGVVDIN